MRHHESHGRSASGHGRRGRRRHGRHHGKGGGDMHAGRMLAQGDLRLIMLALITEQPRHGYEIIKLIEERTEGWYSPSPGIVYPTLTYLEEAGQVTAQAEGARKLYAITADGRADLQENRAVVDAVLERLAAVGERFGRMHRMDDEDDGGRGPKLPPLVRAALDNLRAVATERLGNDAEAETKLVEVLARAAADLRRS
jgi:DNA-binding PadR family transcriptional regulator